MKTLTEAQRAQLLLLQKLGATSNEAAVGKHSCFKGAQLLNPGMIAVALVPKGLAGRREAKPWNGEPKRTFYWITDAGVAALAADQAGDRS